MYDPLTTELLTSTVQKIEETVFNSQTINIFELFEPTSLPTKEEDFTPAYVTSLQKFIHLLQISCLSLNIIKHYVAELVETVLTVCGRPIDEYFSTTIIGTSTNLTALNCFFIQVVVSLSGASIIEILKKSLCFENRKHNLPWTIINSLISVVSVCVKGGVRLIKDLLNELLVLVFTPIADYSGQNDQYGDLLEILSDSTEENVDDMELEDGNYFLLKSVILIARQLCSEDVRVVGCTYEQWWRLQFASNPLSSTKRNSGVLSSRRSVAFLINQLMSLLPFDRQTAFLRTQILVIPFWISEKTSDRDLSIENEKLLSAWTDYVDIAKCRLAELKTKTNDVVRVSTKINSFNASLCEWENVERLLEKVCLQSLTSNAKQNCKTTTNLPACVVEMNLFRPQYFREHVIPLLRCPPSNVLLNAEMENARHCLLKAIDIQIYNRPIRKQAKIRKLTKHQ